jgi:4-aminobutyrate aminotransferase-like enzyme
MQLSIGFHEPMVQLINDLTAVMPDKSLDTFFFTNSGAEAVENAIKIARHATGMWTNLQCLLRISSVKMFSIFPEN